MGSHPINLAVRFLLEVMGLAALAWIGWQYGKGVYKYVFAIGLPLLAACLWGVFAVPGDPGRSGNTVVAVPGLLRLTLETGFFAAATWSLIAVGAEKLGWIYAATVTVHYIVSFDRVVWLVRQ